jgi:esterase/lipase
MKDSILVKKTGKGYKMTRTLSEDMTQEQIYERIKKMEGELEAYTDTRDNLVENKEEILRKNSEKIDNDVKAYNKAIINLGANIQALKDAVTLGQGKASSVIKGDTVQGAVE